MPNRMGFDLNIKKDASGSQAIRNALESGRNLGASESVLGLTGSSMQ